MEPVGKLRVTKLVATASHFRQAVREHEPGMMRERRPCLSGSKTIREMKLAFIFRPYLKVARKTGVVIASVCYWMILVIWTDRPVASLIVALSWSMGLVVGSKWPLFRWFLFKEPGQPDPSLSWGRGLVFSICSTGIAALVIKLG